MLKVKTSIRVTELDTVCATICRIYGECTCLHEDKLLQKVMDELSQLSAQMNLSIHQDKIQSDLDNADVLRDECLRNFGKLLDGYAAFPLKDKRDAAERILNIYGKYRKTIISANYASESSLIKSLLKDISAPEVVALCESLDGIPQIIAALQSAQNAFLMANDAYVNAKSTKLTSASSLKKTMIKLVNEQFAPYVGAATLIDPQVYEAFSKQIDLEIQRANASNRAPGATSEVVSQE